MQSRFEAMIVAKRVHYLKAK
ncbi:hypothetical protein SPV1_13834 [Mariprofundus ferrooxydans PV-1]|uniref:Uncharacterized protein n=1 Tax=Mariprofundus ferrooxydans PV-1 TaxID=314345 RepID=Q0EZN5_9PROT|nr:hypothetical protein SPV1_13834 [Mariprofundus ferrooxydans PV-1]